MSVKIMCPKCKWEPKANSMWQCSCGHVWNTFDTAARCPKCHKVWKDTQCLSCLKWSPHLDWYDGLDDEGIPSHNANFNAFSVDMVYNWQFAPGSFMRVVWKNNILTNTYDTSPDFFQNFQSTLAAPQLNSLSVRLIYYLDYVMVRRWFRD